MYPSVARLITEFFTNKEKNLFIVRLTSSLTVTKLGLAGFIGDFVGYFMSSFLGLGVKYGKLGLDLGLDQLEEAMLLPEFEKTAKAAYDKATKRLYTEDEKRAIRQEYLDIVDKFTRLKRVQHNP